MVVKQSAGRYGHAMVTWSDDVDEILASDLAAGFAYLTPAKGVVITPMAPLALRDRQAGTVTLTTSQAMWKKLDRISRNSGVAIAYHARDYGLTNRPGFVLVQGRASFPTTADRDWLESITPEWERFLGPRIAGLPSRILDVYYWQRVPITIEVERIVAYPDDAAAGKPQVLGKPLAEPAVPQNPPAGGTAPRVDAAKVAAHAPAAAAHAARLVRRRRDARGRPGRFGRGARVRSTAQRPGGRGSPGRQTRRADVAPIPAAHDRPGAARSHRLAGERRFGPSEIHAAHEGRLPTSELKARLRPGQRKHRFPDEESARGRGRGYVRSWTSRPAAGAITSPRRSALRNAGGKAASHPRHSRVRLLPPGSPLTLSEDRVSAITWFGERSLFAQFRLPRTLPESVSSP